MNKKSFDLKELVQQQKKTTEKNSKSFNLEAQVNSARKWSEALDKRSETPSKK